MSKVWLMWEKTQDIRGIAAGGFLIGGYLHIVNISMYYIWRQS